MENIAHNLLRQAFGNNNAVADPPLISGCAEDEAAWADAVEVITTKVPALEDLKVLSLQEFRAFDQRDCDALLEMVPFILRVKLRRLQK